MARVIEQPATSIRDLQTFLRIISGEYQDIPHVASDGIFGPETTRAVSAFQTIFRFEPTGIVDYDVWNAIFSIYNRVKREKQPPLQAGPNFVDNIKLGDKGDIVDFIQIMLRLLGNKFSNISNVEATGVFDEKTEQAVLDFQHIAELRSTGVVDKNTWNALTRGYLIHQD